MKHLNWFWLVGSLSFAMTAQVRLLTTELRSYHPPLPAMHGGWGPHLKGLHRASDGSLWFVVDQGKEVKANDRALFYRFDGSRWSKVASLEHQSIVQQNITSHLVDDKIYLYGNRVSHQTIEECKFDTIKKISLECQDIKIGGRPVKVSPLSNYIGSAVSPSKEHFVWWSQVGDAGGTGSLAYLYTEKGKWKGPIVTATAANSLGYLSAEFIDDKQVLLAGEGWFGSYPKGHFEAQLGKWRLGSPASWIKTFLSPSEPHQVANVQDIWLDKRNGNQHVFAYTLETGTLAYYFLEKGSTSAMERPVKTFPNSFRVRTTVYQGALYLGVSSLNNPAKALTVYEFPLAAFDKALPFESSVPLEIASPTESSYAPGGLWVESSRYQSTAVGGVNFSFNGNYPISDATSYHVQITP